MEENEGGPMKWEAQAVCHETGPNECWGPFSPTFLFPTAINTLSTHIAPTARIIAATTSHDDLWT